jgi:RNA polymerase sigma factor (sigma-70 family)
MSTMCDSCPKSRGTTSEETELVLIIGTPADTWTDQQLVQACLRGDDRAWTLLLGRYKNLICSFPRRYGASLADAADVYQLVSVELVFALPRLRNQQSVRSWIITVSAHQACQWKRRYLTRAKREKDDPEATSEAASIRPPCVLEEAEQKRVVREALAQLAPRCQHLLRLLFYEDPPVPYQTIAGRLGLAAGSVTFLRSRCLRKLEQALDQAGMGMAPGRSEQTEQSCKGSPAGPPIGAITRQRRLPWKSGESTAAMRAGARDRAEHHSHAPAGA